MAENALNREMSPEEQQALESVGEVIAGWEVDEYPSHRRGRTWFIAAAIIATALIIYAIATANFLFAVIILMIGVITLVTTLKQPDRIPILVTTTGIVVDENYYDWNAVRSFSIVYDPPEVKLLYIDFGSVMQPQLSIPLEDVDPVALRDAMLPYCPENLDRTEEGLTDIMKRLYKL